jgi:DNA-binding response OmpR family regulator
MPEQAAILLIEDEANLRHNLTVLLEGEGYRVACAEDGAEGLQALQDGPFDLVITDVVMPKVDGFQVMEYLQDHFPDVVVAITAYVSTESAIEALRRGAYDYLAKPFDVDLMQIVIKRALEKARMQKAFRHYMSTLERQVEEHTRSLAEAHIHLEQSIKELRAAQEQLIQTEQFRALGEVTAVVAHELGDSLAMIVGFAQVLAKMAPTESRMKAQLEQIGQEAFRCHEVLKNLVTFPWKQAPQKVLIHLNDVCEQMLMGLAYQTDLSNIVVVRRLDGSLPPIMADPHQLLQAFTSIALSACRSIVGYQGGGDLTVETKRLDGAIQVAFHVDVLRIGKGRQRGLLDPILRSTESTGGLGLSLAYGIIKEHAGRIAVHSIPGEGTSYVLELPVHEPLPPTVEPPSGELQVVGRRVLVVAADEKSLALLNEIVRHLGHEAERSSTALQALQNIADRDYDLIIADMYLPEMDGLDLYQRLRVLRPGLAQRVLFICGGALSDEVDAFLERVGCPLIRKPFTVADIEAAMRQMLAL